jgi:hypothetical protein
MESRISGNSSIVVGKDLLACDLAGEAIILDSKLGVYYGLDPVGARIWNLIQNEKTVRELLDTLLEEYEVEHERCDLDLQNLLHNLAVRDLIKIRPGT